MKKESSIKLDENHRFHRWRQLYRGVCRVSIMKMTKSWHMTIMQIRTITMAVANSTPNAMHLLNFTIWSEWIVHSSSFHHIKYAFQENPAQFLSIAIPESTWIPCRFFCKDLLNWLNNNNLSRIGQTESNDLRHWTGHDGWRKLWFNPIYDFAKWSFPPSTNHLMNNPRTIYFRLFLQKCEFLKNVNYQHISFERSGLQNHDIIRHHRALLWTLHANAKYVRNFFLLMWYVLLLL